MLKRSPGRKGGEGLQEDNPQWRLAWSRQPCAQSASCAGAGTQGEDVAFTWRTTLGLVCMGVCVSWSLTAPVVRCSTLALPRTGARMWGCQSRGEAQVDLQGGLEESGSSGTLTASSQRWCRPSPGHRVIMRRGYCRANYGLGGQYPAVTPTPTLTFNTQPAPNGCFPVLTWLV